MHNIVPLPATSAANADEPQQSLIFRLRKAMPQPAKKVFQFVKGVTLIAFGAIYDAMRFARYSGALRSTVEPASVKANITKYYHMIEKGLTLPSPRPGFGRQAIQDLCLKVQKALKIGIVDVEIRYALDAIAGYHKFNVAQGVSNPPWIAETLAMAAEHDLVPIADPIRRPQPTVPTDAQTLIDFITSRHSIRHFADGPVPEEVLIQATRAAQAAPCVCNRQASRVYFAQDPELRKRLLACQNGNRGFGDTAPVVALVTVDLRSFMDGAERYQAWIDGGLFAMNLLLGFHAQGFGACCLNWSALPAQDRKLRKLGVIPQNETVIMMMAIGARRDDIYVARSQRFDVEQVMKVL